MSPSDYYLDLLGRVFRNSYVVENGLQYEQPTDIACHVFGILTLRGGYRLHVSEYVETNPEIVRRKYRYHLSGPDGSMVCRWDNASHHAHLTTHPHHQHLVDGQVVPSEVRNLLHVLERLSAYLH